MTRWKFRVSQGCAFAVSFFSLLSLGGRWLGWEVRIDEFFFGIFASYGSAPGRMPSLSALMFLMLGLALLLLNTQTRQHHPFQWLSLVAILISLLALVAFAYASVSISSRASPASLAIHSVALFLLLSLAILFAHPECGLLAVVTSESMGGTLARRLLPAAIVVPIALGWLTMEGLRSGTLNTFVWLAVYAVSNLVVFAVVIWRTAGSLHATEQRRKAAEEALAREHGLLRLLLDNLPASVYVKDPEGRYLVYNAAAVHLVGVASEAAALGKTVFDFFPPEIARLYNADDRRLLATGQASPRSRGANSGPRRQSTLVSDHQASAA